MFELSKQFRFEAAHTLERVVDVEGSRCIHGHSYRAEVVIRGKADPKTGMVVDLGLFERALETVRIGLRELHVPEKRRSELENVPDVLSERRRLNPFSPRHVSNFAESDLLDLVGELLPFHLVGCAHPVGDELFELRDVRLRSVLGAV